MSKKNNNAAKKTNINMDVGGGIHTDNRKTLKDIKLKL